MDAAWWLALGRTSLTKCSLGYLIRQTFHIRKERPKKSMKRQQKGKALESLSAPSQNVTRMPGTGVQTFSFAIPSIPSKQDTPGFSFKIKMPSEFWFCLSSCQIIPMHHWSFKAYACLHFKESGKIIWKSEGLLLAYAMLSYFVNLMVHTIFSHERC